jgi:hypothetical protein
LKIGLLMPARERLNLNLTLISSIITTVDDINNITLYMGIDDDDPTREIQMKIAEAIPFVKFVPIHNEGKFIGLGKMWNILARECDDEIFGYIGNDMIFRTPGWDTKIINKFKNDCPKDNIQLYHCDDGYRHDALCVNAFVHRKYMEEVGYFIREEFLINWSDSWMMEVFGSFGRVEYIPDILIEHNHWVFGKRNIDSTGKRMMTADAGGKSDKLWEQIVPEKINEIKKLAKYLGMKPNWDKVSKYDVKV